VKFFRRLLALSDPRAVAPRIRRITVPRSPLEHRLVGCDRVSLAVAVAALLPIVLSHGFNGRRMVRVLEMVLDINLLDLLEATPARASA
jgi:hypothetical protein